MSRRAAVVVIVLAVVALGAVPAWLVRPIGPDAFARNGTPLEFFDRDGLPLGTIYSLDRARAVQVPLSDVAGSFVQTIVAVQDPRFAQVHGFDIVRGDSTITMRLARLQYRLPDTWLGRVREMSIAIRLDRGIGKRGILTAYMNRLPLGAHCIGVEAAAQTYFGVPAASLDWAQSAALVALAGNPGALDPYAHPDAWLTPSRAILSDIFDRGLVPEQTYHDALTERVEPRPLSESLGLAPQLIDRLAALAPPNETRLNTTIDREMQRFVDGALAHERDASAIVVENVTGDVLAYAGTPDERLAQSYVTLARGGAAATLRTLDTDPPNPVPPVSHRHGSRIAGRGWTAGSTRRETVVAWGDKTASATAWRAIVAYAGRADAEKNAFRP